MHELRGNRKEKGKNEKETRKTCASRRTTHARGVLPINISSKWETQSSSNAASTSARDLFIRSHPSSDQQPLREVFTFPLLSLFITAVSPIITSTAVIDLRRRYASQPRFLSESERRHRCQSRDFRSVDGRAERRLLTVSRRSWDSRFPRELDELLRASSRQRQRQLTFVADDERFVRLVSREIVASKFFRLFELPWRSSRGTFRKLQTWIQSTRYFLIFSILIRSEYECGDCSCRSRRRRGRERKILARD